MENVSTLRSKTKENFFPHQAEVISFDKITSADIEWLWPDRIPLGTLTLIAGDPGVGKSFLTLYLAARASTGGPWPDSESWHGLPAHEDTQNTERSTQHADTSPGSVLIINTEDSPPRIMRPRLIELKAKLSKIRLIPFVRHQDNNGNEYTDQLNILTDLFALERAISEIYDLKLIIIDPLIAFFGQYDTRNDSYVRNILGPLKKLAAKYNVAVVGVMHLNKGSSTNAIYRTMGSLAFSSSARSIWLVSSVPNSSGSPRRLFIPVKNNMLEKPSALAFEIKDNRVVFEKDPVNVPAELMLSSQSNIDSPELNRAIDWLTNLLANGQPLPSRKILRLAELQFFKNGTLQRARKEIGVVCFPDFDEEGNKLWLWKLPALPKTTS
jgi:putative DNA primase/helicase